MAEFWEVRELVEWYLAEADRYEWMGQYKNIPISLGMAQEKLDSVARTSRKDPEYRKLRICLKEKAELYRDHIEQAAREQMNESIEGQIIDRM